MGMTNDALRVAIIGTRTPDEVQACLAADIALGVSKQGYTVTTGGASGTDNEAMKGALPGHLEVYLPWKSYNSHLIPRHAEVIVYDPFRHVTWMTSVRRYHPAPLALSRAAFALHARNFGIVHEAVAVLAMPDELGGGGTAQGMRIARGLGIPVIECRKGTGMSSVPRIDDVLWTIEGYIKSKAK